LKTRGEGWPGQHKVSQTGRQPLQNHFQIKFFSPLFKKMDFSNKIFLLLVTPFFAFLQFSGKKEQLPM